MPAMKEAAFLFLLITTRTPTGHVLYRATAMNLVSVIKRKPPWNGYRVSDSLPSQAVWPCFARPFFGQMEPVL